MHSLGTMLTVPSCVIDVVVPIVRFSRKASFVLSGDHDCGPSSIPRSPLARTRLPAVLDVATTSCQGTCADRRRNVLRRRIWPSARRTARGRTWSAPARRRPGSSSGPPTPAPSRRPVEARRRSSCRRATKPVARPEGEPVAAAVEGPRQRPRCPAIGADDLEPVAPLCPCMQAISPLTGDHDGALPPELELPRSG